MITAYIGVEGALLVARQGQGRWRTERHLDAKAIECVAADPLRPERVYCGTRGQGLWRSDDAGASWRASGDGIAYGDVTSVAISAVERVGNYGVVYAGTEPTAIFRSEDGGATWQDRSGLTKLPSAATWSFPPRPWTHHARWIALDPRRAGWLWVCAEAGATVRSSDAGQTWEDRKPDTPFDTHTLRTHPLAPGRLYAAAGDGFMWPGAGYAESRDDGATWERLGDGLHYHYLWGLAVDPSDADTIVASAAAGPQQAHSPMAAEATLYRRCGGGAWQEVRPAHERTGTLIYSLAANAAEPHVFYAASNRGLYRSRDAGLSWEQQEIDWPDDYRMRRPAGLEVVEV
jgi:hypothetical protein